METRANATKRSTLVHIHWQLIAPLSPTFATVDMVQLGRITLSFASILSVAQCFLHAHAALLNITVDDAGPDPDTGARVAYSNDSIWNFGPACQSCWGHLDPTNVYNRTWHSATYDAAMPGLSIPQTATFKFTGIYLLKNISVVCH